MPIERVWSHHALVDLVQSLLMVIISIARINLVFENETQMFLNGINLPFVQTTGLFACGSDLEETLQPVAEISARHGTTFRHWT